MSLTYLPSIKARGKENIEPGLIYVIRKINKSYSDPALDLCPLLY